MRICVTGGTGFLGRAVVHALDAQRCHAVVAVGKAEFNLRYDAAEFRQWLAFNEFDAVIHLAYPSYGGGIGAITAHPWDLLRDCVRIDHTVIEACVEAKIPILLGVGSVCGYGDPDGLGALLPQREDQYLDGALDGPNAPYGWAKRLQLVALQAARTQYGLNGVHLILDNLYGPGDRSGHVIPVTIQKCLAAVREGTPEIVAWGTGTAEREFLYVDDAARGIVAALDRAAQIGPEPINLVSGQPLSLRRLVDQIATLTGFTGTIRWDASRPEGSRRRYYTAARAADLLDWAPTTPLADGLRTTVAAHRLEAPRG